MDKTETFEGKAHKLMKEAWAVLTNSSTTRETALAKTKLEEAIMWNNKNRAIRGELEKSDTFVG